MKCPVCGVVISSDGKTVYCITGREQIEGYTVFRNGETYRFCSSECMKLFESEPKKYEAK